MLVEKVWVLIMNQLLHIGLMQYWEMFYSLSYMGQSIEE